MRIKLKQFLDKVFLPRWLVLATDMMMISIVFMFTYFLRFNLISSAVDISKMLIQLVAQGCFTPLDDFIARSGRIRMDDFIPFCRESVEFEGRVWGMPTTTDTYCLLWNKNAFRKAGLDPERPPATLKELEEFAARLMIQDASGIQQIGFLPWQPWDLTTMWGLFFGGTWYDTESGQAVCGSDPNLLRMMYWQRSYALDPNSKDNPPFAMDPQKILSFQAGSGSYMSANNPFYSGKVAMIAEGEWQATFIPKYAPELDWGVAPLPMPEGIEPLAYGGSVVADCIPRGCKHPEEAWAFLEWFYSPRPNGAASPASDYNFAIHNIPPRTAEARQPRFADDPKFGVFVDVLMKRRVVFLPTTPLSQFFGDEMERQRERMAFRKTTPEQALQDIQDVVNKELADVRKLMKRARS